VSACRHSMCNVGVGLALPLSGPAEMRGRQAIPLQREIRNHLQFVVCATNVTTEFAGIVYVSEPSVMVAGVCWARDRVDEVIQGTTELAICVPTSKT